MLSWSLVICTLNRRTVLEKCLLAALQQSLLPQQIIIVDASNDWEESKETILTSFAKQKQGIEWIYVDSKRRSLPHQRNIGIQHCTSDIVFLFDDDSFMYPTCAEEIMKVYENDTAKQVGGVTALLTDQLPPCLTTDGGKAVTDPVVTGNALFAPLHTLWNQEYLFIPYDGKYYTYDISTLQGQVSIFPVKLFHGCRMTYRTSIIRDLGGFNEVLMYSAVGEDIDMSYRVSRTHALVAAREALLLHEQTKISRVNRFTNTVLVLLNDTALLLLNTERKERVSFAIYQFMFTRLILEFLRDCAKPGRGFPNSRGVWYAMQQLPQMLSMDKEQLRNWYPEFQTELINRKNRLQQMSLNPAR